ncbi:phenylacetate--CoA ligase family protein [Brevibacillus ginsengisoli]|uniref:phenylacetate--CoA ligase family protein n=1 Tax=Brevibacillus ginsengisoli TaxID=363854 RepID=UPI003CFB3AC9
MSIKRLVWEKRVSLQGRTLEYLDKLREWQWLSPEQITSLQQERLYALLDHAYRHTSYYRQLFEQHGLVTNQGEIKLDEFQKLPFLNKEQIRTNYAQLTSDDLATRKWYENTTGGSTGVATRLILDRDYFAWNQAIKILDDEWTGRSLIDKQVRLWGLERSLMEGKERFRTRIGCWLRNERWLSCLRMTPDVMRSYIKEINTFQPKQILAYVESLYELARFCELEKMVVHPPKAIMTSAGTLYPHMRKKLEQVFQAPVFNRYGSTEVGDMACECERHKGLHVSSLTHFIEIIDRDGNPAKPGEIGEIVVTPLINYAMPFIRYRIGDMGRWSTASCDCGRGYPLLEEITGRVNDIFVDRKGRWIDGMLFLLLIDPRPFVKKFQVIQEKPDLVRVLIVPYPEHQVAYSLQEEIRQIKSQIRKVMECEVEVELCEQIDPTPSGKYRYTISQVPR